MITPTALKDQVMQGHIVTKGEAFTLIDANLEEVCAWANEIRIHFCQNKFDICTIINGKSGRCTENCKYCAQSAHYKTTVDEYPLLDQNTLLEGAIHNHQNGILRYSIVTSGKSLTDDEVHLICKSYQHIKASCEISLCASHGLLNVHQFIHLKSAGVTRYHNNLETSRRYFSHICTTHTYDDKITAIKNAKQAGLEVCSGGIIGLGENMEDRIDLALELRNLEIDSIPINLLTPILGTPLANLPLLSNDEVRRTIAIFRFILPKAAIRLAGGRGLLEDKGRSVFLSGANAAISGDMLTTSGISTDEDMTILQELGYEVNLL